MTEIRSLARGHTKRAIRVLAGIMDSQHSSDDAKIRAATALLDRGWGRPSQAIGQDPELEKVGFVYIDPTLDDDEEGDLLQ